MDVQNHASYDQWVDQYELAYQAPRSLADLPCPNCSARSLRLVFLVDQMTAEIGTAVFWCENCNFGLLPSGAIVPVSGNTLLWGTEQIPNYRIIPPH